MHTTIRITGLALIAASLLTHHALGADAVDLNVTGYLFATGDLDINGNTASFGTEGADAGYIFNYVPTTDTIEQNATSAAANWIWRRGATGGGYQNQMQLSSSNAFTLSDPTTGLPATTLTPNGVNTLRGSFLLQTNLQPSNRSYGWRNAKWGGGGAATDIAWKKLARLQPANSSIYDSIGFEGKIYDHRNNHAAGLGVTVPFSGRVRGYTVDTASVEQGLAENQYIRIVRLGVRDFELQVRNPVLYRWMEVEWRITGNYPGTSSNPGTITYYDEQAIVDGTSPALVENEFLPIYLTLNSFGNLWAQNISIGKTSTAPAEALDVLGNAKITGNLNVTGNFVHQGVGASGSGSTSRLRVGGTIDPNGSYWGGAAVVGANGQNKVIAGYLGSSTNGAVIGAHNSDLTGWADLNVAGTNLIFRTDQTERMRINAAGDVGIGTTSPAAKLHVVGKVYAQTAVGQTFFHGHQLGTSYSNSLPIFTAQSDNPNGGQNYYFRGQAGGVTKFEVRADGRSYFGGDVGVGTNNLAGGINDFSNNNLIDGRLQIRADGSDATALFIKGNSTEYAGMKIKVGPSNISGAPDYYDITVRPSYGPGVNTGPDVSAIRINNTKPRTHPDVLINKDGGNVGIGTTAPTATLDIAGSVNVTGAFTQASIESIPIYARGSNNASFLGRIVYFNNQSYSAPALGPDTNTSLRGFAVLVIDRATLAVDSNINYDVYGVDAARIAMADALNALPNTKFVLITSSDAWSVNTALKAALLNVGASPALFATNGRKAYALLGIPGIGAGNGMEAYNEVEDGSPLAVISTTLTRPAAVTNIPYEWSNRKDNTFLKNDGSVSFTTPVNIASTLTLNGSPVLASTGTQTITGTTTLVGTTTVGGTSSPAQLRVDGSTGNVSVGTASTAQKVNVAGTSSFAGKSWFTNGSNISGYSWMNAAITTDSIEIVNHNAAVESSAPTLGFHRYGSGGPQFRLGPTGDKVLYLESANSNSARNPNPYGGGPNQYFERFHVDGKLSTTGNVSIGTSATTTAKLDVAGTVQIAGSVTIKNVGASKSVIRISPAGDIDMGTFRSGTNPNPPSN